MPDISFDDQIAEVKREIAMRRSVYPRWVAQGRLTEDVARRQIDVMVEVGRTLQRAKTGQGSLL